MVYRTPLMPLQTVVTNAIESFCYQHNMVVLYNNPSQLAGSVQGVYDTM